MYLYICILYRKSYFAYKFPETLDRYEHFFFEKDKHCTTHFQLLNLKLVSCSLQLDSCLMLTYMLALHQLFHVKTLKNGK